MYSDDLTDGNEVECNFENHQNNGTLETKFHNIDHGSSLTRNADRLFSYANEDGLLKLINGSQCHQSVDQICQPWVQLLYELDDSIVKDSSLPGWTWDHIHTCTCLRYNTPLINSTSNDSSR